MLTIELVLVVFFNPRVTHNPPPHFLTGSERVRPRADVAGPDRARRTTTGAGDGPACPCVAGGGRALRTTYEHEIQTVLSEASPSLAEGPRELSDIISPKPRPSGRNQRAHCSPPFDGSLRTDSRRPLDDATIFHSFFHRPQLDQEQA